MSLMSHKSREFDSDVVSIKGHEGRVTRSICIMSGVQHGKGETVFATRESLRYHCILNTG